MGGRGGRVAGPVLFESGKSKPRDVGLLPPLCLLPLREIFKFSFGANENGPTFANQKYPTVHRVNQALKS